MHLDAPPSPHFVFLCFDTIAIFFRVVESKRIHSFKIQPSCASAHIFNPAIQVPCSERRIYCLPTRLQPTSFETAGPPLSHTCPDEKGIPEYGNWLHTQIKWRERVKRVKVRQPWQHQAETDCIGDWHSLAHQRRPYSHPHGHHSSPFAKGL